VSDVADEIETQFVIERRVPDVGRSRFQQRVTIGGRPNNHIGREIAACAGLVVNDDLLTELLG
jgi:hypothetical protein